jgi:predicted MFS family arabinose efflux permease
MMDEASSGEPALPSSPPSSPDLHLSPREWLLLLVLAAVQFTHIVDFMIIMPLGSRFINDDPAAQEGSLHLTTGQFGLVVSAYTLSAGIASLLAARFLDRFDRKKSLLALLAGFTVGTLLCAAATNYPLLLMARAVAGAFGGVCAANILAIIGDAFHHSRRGTANGVVMTAFSVASIVGVPMGLYLTEHLGWRSVFVVLGGLAGCVLLLATWVLPSLKGHLLHVARQANTWEVATDPNHVRAYALMFALVSSSFLVVPYLAASLVANVGLAESDLKYMYLAGGLTTLLTLPLIGRLADRLGKLPVFRVFALTAMVPLFLITVLPHGLGLPLVLVVTTFMFVATSGRMVPGMALITNSSTPQVRGSFMSLNSAVQQLGAGIASAIGGLLLGKGPDGHFTGYPTVGLLACVAAVASVYLAGHLRAAPGGESAPDTEALKGPDLDAAPPTSGEAALRHAIRSPSPLVGERSSR